MLKVTVIESFLAVDFLKDQSKSDDSIDTKRSLEFAEDESFLEPGYFFRLLLNWVFQMLNY